MRTEGAAALRSVKILTAFLVYSCKRGDESAIRGPELETKLSDPDDSKYIVKNKDTGEVFDIRDLASMPADSYSIFPNNFVAPQEEEVRGI